MVRVWRVIRDNNHYRVGVGAGVGVGAVPLQVRLEGTGQGHGSDDPGKFEGQLYLSLDTKGSGLILTSAWGGGY